MNTIVIAVVVIAAAALLFFGLRAAKVWREQRGTRVITCPEIEQSAAVNLDVARAMRQSVAGGSDLQLRDCTLWPDRRDCDQACLRQIEQSPDGCLAKSILETWYGEKDCVLCGESMTPINWLEQKPGLRLENGRYAAWSDVRPETLPEVLETSDAVCFNCLVNEGFRQQHPELVIDRPWKEPVVRHHP